MITFSRIRSCFLQNYFIFLQHKFHFSLIPPPFLGCRLAFPGTISFQFQCPIFKSALPFFLFRLFAFCNTIATSPIIPFLSSFTLSFLFHLLALFNHFRSKWIILCFWAANANFIYYGFRQAILLAKAKPVDWKELSLSSFSTSSTSTLPLKFLRKSGDN